MLWLPSLPARKVHSTRYVAPGKTWAHACGRGVGRAEGPGDEEGRLKANLTLTDNFELLKRLSPKIDRTGDSEEIRIERLVLSVRPQKLPFSNLSVDHDGDYKDAVRGSLV